MDRKVWDGTYDADGLPVTLTIGELVEAGRTPAEIFGLTVADTRHARDIKATGGNAAAGDPDLLHVLSSKMSFMYLDEVTAGWRGVLIDEMSGRSESDLLRLEFRKLMAITQLTDRPIYCNTFPPTGSVVTGITQLCQALVDNQNYYGFYNAAMVKAELDMLTGGPIWEGVTQAEIDGLIADYNATKAEGARTTEINNLQTELMNNYINPALAEGSSVTAAQLRQAIKENL